MVDSYNAKMIGFVVIVRLATIATIFIECIGERCKHFIGTLSSDPRSVVQRNTATYIYHTLYAFYYAIISI